MILSVLVLAGLLASETPDSLQAAKVVADSGATVSRSDTVRISNAISFTDAFSSLPGLYVSDYGGPASPVNVSLRGMGSPHAAIYLDGVRLGNVQSGQVDLGMLDLCNLGTAVIDYARSSLSFSTAKPVFRDRNVGGFVGFRGGSFGTFEPSLRLDFRLSDRVSLSATTTGVLSNGDFPLGDGSRRENNDIRQVRAGLDAWGIVDGGDWHLKGFFNGAGRGTPGSVYLPSTDRQNDRNAFIQGTLRKQFSSLYLLDFSAKAACDDLTFSGEYGDSRYSMTEAQVNTAHKFSFNGWLDAAVSADFGLDALSSTLYTGARTSLFSSVCVCFHPRRFRSDVSLEYSGMFDRGGKTHNVVSPSVDIRWNVCGGLDLLAFARRSYRAPTFNELYYPGYGNPELKPEDAWLTDAGVEYYGVITERWHFRTRADAFLNNLMDKIVSAPTESDPNIWLPYNIGVVQVAGADINASADYAGGGFKAAFRVQYCFQDAIDKTPGSDSFGCQAPYISKHTLCLGGMASCRGWSADLSWNWRGERYDTAGRMPDYNTLNLTFGKDFSLPEDFVLGLRLYARNMFNCSYCLISGYPMPGRSFYGEVNFRF